MDSLVGSLQSPFGPTNLQNPLVRLPSAVAWLWLFYYLHVRFPSGAHAWRFVSQSYLLWEPMPFSRLTLRTFVLPWSFWWLTLNFIKCDWVDLNTAIGFVNFYFTFFFLLPYSIWGASQTIWLSTMIWDTMDLEQRGLLRECSVQYLKKGVAMK